MALTEKQIDCINLLLKGTNKAEIARQLNVARQTIYDWMKGEEFASALDNHTAQKKIETDRNITSNVDRYVTELEKIAFHGKSEKTRAETLQYLIDRVLGKPTAKTQDVTEGKKEGEASKELTWEQAKKDFKTKHVKKA